MSSGFFVAQTELGLKQQGFGRSVGDLDFGLLVYRDLVLFLLLLLQGCRRRRRRLRGKDLLGGGQVDDPPGVSGLVGEAHDLLQLEGSAKICTELVTGPELDWRLAFANPKGDRHLGGGVPHPFDGCGVFGRRQLVSRSRLLELDDGLGGGYRDLRDPSRLRFARQCHTRRIGRHRRSRHGDLVHSSTVFSPVACHQLSIAADTIEEGLELLLALFSAQHQRPPSVAGR